MTEKKIHYGKVGEEGFYLARTLGRTKEVKRISVAVYNYYCLWADPDGEVKVSIRRTAKDLFLNKGQVLRANQRLEGKLIETIYVGSGTSPSIYILLDGIPRDRKFKKPQKSYGRREFKSVQEMREET